MNDIKMIVTDLDDTLLHTDKSISNDTLQLLHEFQQRGGIVVIATARFWIGAEKIINLLKPDYEITTDGTMIHHKGKYVYGQGYSLEISNKIIQSVLDINPSAEICTAVKENVYWNSTHIAESEKLHKAVYNDFRMPLGEEAYKFFVTLPSRESAYDIAQKCESKVITYRGENEFGLIPVNAGKIHMIKWLSDYLDISLKNVVTFGDDENDVEMLKLCGTGVAVENALPKVKEVADDIAPTNDNDGVYKWLKAHLQD